MKKIESKTSISDEIFSNLSEYTYGCKSMDVVTFVFVNVKAGRKNPKRGCFTYKQALELARYRQGDKRYKNFIYEIITAEEDV